MSFRTDAQTVMGEQVLFSESESLAYTNPDEGLKVALHLLSLNISDTEKNKVNLLIAEIYTVKGDYSNALNYLFKVDEETEDDPFLLIKAAVGKSEILRTLYLDNQARFYFDEAQNRLQSVSDSNELKIGKSLLFLEEVGMLLDKQKFDAAIQLIEKNKTIIDDISDKHSDIWMRIMISKGKALYSKDKLEESIVCFESVLNRIAKEGNKNDYGKALVLLGLANVNFQKKEHKIAVAEILEAMKTTKLIDNDYLSRKIRRQLIANYIALNDQSNYKFYNAEFLKINTEVDAKEQESVNTAHNLISKSYEENYKGKRADYLRYMYLLLAIFLIGAVLSAVYWFRVVGRQRRLEEVINYLEITRNNLLTRTRQTESSTEKKTVKKKSTIPEETEQLLLTKLKKFESSSRFLSKEMSLSVLAGQFDTNTKYLSEIINTHYEVNFNTYINRLRISYIVEKLKTDSNYLNYKISYLADVSGFSSHSSFATVFKSITGIAPVTFIELLTNENTNLNTASDDEAND
ncbi:helix-turn-helix domain-containing protein [Flavobacterium sp.]|uniref:helix-turn-helix domain-containing protein n=1 Tax=Flavobacterium sp. TaxID=239 RepID=UPI0028BD3D5E|nr:helix-turn-helix domain-containing protein [Flavobacterium sp.]